MSTWTLEKKVAQLLTAAYYDDIQDKYAPPDCGGIWTRGVPKDSAEVTRQTLRELQDRSEVGLFICVDFETGAGQFMPDGSCAEYPGLMAFSAIPREAESYARRAGEIMSEEATWLGANFAYTPVFDVNTVPQNPICGTRSAGDTPETVARVAGAMALGMQKHRLLACAKHFPGEGMHTVDPHRQMEQMTVSLEEMTEVHMAPYRFAAERGVGAVMTNHAIYPPLDPDHQATISEKVLGYLREDIGFSGIITTDAMGMKGISSVMGPEEAAVKAIAAGHDLILNPEADRPFVEYVSEAVRSGRLPESRIEESCERILAAKEKLGLLKLFEQPEPPTPLEERWDFAREVGRRSLTLVRDRNGLLPQTALRDASVLVIEPVHPQMKDRWNDYAGLSSFFPALRSRCREVVEIAFASQTTAEQVEVIVAAAKEADLIIAGGCFNLRGRYQPGLLDTAQVAMLEQVVAVNRNTVFVLGNPYTTSELPFAGTVLVNYGPFVVSCAAAVEAIAGEIEPHGQLPVRLPEYLDPALIHLPE